MKRYLVEVGDGWGLDSASCDFLVIGSGVAGLMAAIQAAGAGSVIILTKGEASEGSTGDAQGGVAVALPEWNSVEGHLEDTMRAGAGLCNEEAVRVLVTEGVDAVRELIAWGAQFDQKDGSYDFTQEGGHRKRRIIHAKGDATGAEIERTLLKKLHSAGCVELYEGVFALDLTVEDGRCTGAVAWDAGRSRPVLFRGEATILATGGLGQVYEDTTNPWVSTGDGFAMAYRAGCELEGMEFIQFHPTTLAIEGAPRFLISEAVRGEGAILRNANGERFMPDWHELGDLAPRDIACRAIVDEMRHTRTPHVLLDVTHLRPAFVKARFPTIDRTCRSYGLDITSQPIPVRPAAHFAMGGVRTDLDGATSMAGLYACGETASTGVHGGNRLASNSLLEGLVFGRRAAEAAVRARRGRQEQAHAEAGGRFSRVEKAAGKSGAARPDELAGLRAELRHMMERRVGIIRCQPSLEEVALKLREWDGLLDKEFSQPAAFELQNMVTLAELIVTGALQRQESRGAHYREDFPERDDRSWKGHIIQKRPD